MNTSPAIKESLYQSWQSLVNSLAILEEPAARTWLDLVARYEENGRFYHNLTHIHHVLEMVEMMGGELVDKTAVQLAAWFHDVVYDPKSNENELKSADFAVRLLIRWQLPSQQVQHVKQLILATERHVPFSPENMDCLILLDADLAILGEAATRYRAYALAIRQEYSFVQEEMYRKGRRNVLQSFLQRPQLYFTELMQSRMQATAEANLRWELNEMGSS